MEIRNALNQLVSIGQTNPLPIAPNRVATYSAVIPGIVPTATGVILLMQGVASKVIRIKRVSLHGNQSTAGSGNMEVRRYSAAPTGTQAPLTSYPLDSDNVAAQAVLNTILTPAGGGTLTGRYRAAPMLLGSATVPEVGVDFDFDGLNDQGLLIRGVNEFFGVYFNAASFTGVGLYGFVEWTEE